MSPKRLLLIIAGATCLVPICCSYAMITDMWNRPFTLSFTLPFLGLELVGLIVLLAFGVFVWKLEI